MSRARALLDGTGTKPGTPVVRRAERLMRKAGNQAAWAVRYAPDVVKRAIVEENYEPAMKAISTGIKNGDPWAVQAWLNAADVSGMHSIAKAMLARMGVTDETEAVAMVSRARELSELERMPPERQRALCESYLIDVYQRDAAAWRAFRERMEGLSMAEEVQA